MAADILVPVSSACAAALEHPQVTQDTIGLYFLLRRHVKGIFMVKPQGITCQ
jgi:hypothetical protein